MNYSELTPMQLDALKEVCNIGTGNAATALSQLLNKKVDMTVPALRIIPFDAIIDGMESENEVFGVIVRVLGDTPGNILFVFDKETALDIIELLTGSKAHEVDEMGISVLCEIGNIISSFLHGAISRFTNLTNMPSVPGITYDMIGAILSTTFIESGQFDDSVFDLETEFLEDNNNKISGHFYYIPMPGSLEKILNTLGVQLSWR